MIRPFKVAETEKYLGLKKFGTIVLPGEKNPLGTAQRI